MIDLFTIFLLILAAVVMYMTGWFAIALVLKRNDVADIAWGLGFVYVTGWCLLAANGGDARLIIISILVAVWGARLSLHVLFRNKDKPEDPRYQNWRKEWGKQFILRSYVQVFLLQGFFMVLVALPVLVVTDAPIEPVRGWALAGIILWLVGFFFEVVGDWQLQKFKSETQNSGKILMTGLWKYSRHPNYFGEITMWWGIFLIALPVYHGILAAIGPLTITFLLLRVSGIPMLEAKYKDNAAFQQYAAKTSPLLPLTQNAYAAVKKIIGKKEGLR